MKTTIIYHKQTETADCPDGIMAAAVAALSLESDFELMGDFYRKATDYPEIPGQEQYPFNSGDELIIVDFSYPAKWLKFWETNNIKLKIIDHHAAKFPMLEGFAGAILDEKECGATLTWKHFFPNVPLPELLVHVRRRDIGADGYYRGEVRDSEAINEGLSTWRHKFEAKLDMLQVLGEKLVANDSAFIEELKAIGEPKLEERDKIVAAAVQRATLNELDGYVVPWIRLSKDEARYYSIIGNAMAKAHPIAKFAWLETPDGRQHLRSVNGFDVRPIAQSHGGDGHPPAAGFEF